MKEEVQNTKEFAQQWVNDGQPCRFQYGFGWKGASSRAITNEEAKRLLPNFSFGMGYYEMSFIEYKGQTVLLFNEFSEGDMY